MCSPCCYDKTQLAHAVQQSRRLLEEGRHLGVLVDRTLDRQEAPVQLVNQTHVYYVAARNTCDRNMQWLIKCFPPKKLKHIYHRWHPLQKKISSHRGKQRPLLCLLPQHCSWKRIPHLSPPPPAITVISPICLWQWQVSWSCSLYSFSRKSLLIVSLEGFFGPCARPALGPWQSADLGPSSRSSGVPAPPGSAQAQTAYEKGLTSHWCGHCSSSYDCLDSLLLSQSFFC